MSTTTPTVPTVQKPSELDLELVITNRSGKSPRFGISSQRSLRGSSARSLSTNNFSDGGDDEKKYKVNIQLPEYIPTSIPKNTHPLYKIIQNRFWKLLITLIAFIAMYGGDIVIVGFDNPSGDRTWIIILWIIFSIFSIDLIFSFISIPSYRFRLLFFIDIISILSIILEIYSSDIIASSLGGGIIKSSILLRSARIAQIGTRIGRAIRVVRVASLIQSLKGRGKQNQQIDTSSLLSIGKEIANMTINKVILIVLFTALIFPLLIRDQKQQLCSQEAIKGMIGISTKIYNSNCTLLLSKQESNNQEFNYLIDSYYKESKKYGLTKNGVFYIRITDCDVIGDRNKVFPNGIKDVLSYRRVQELFTVPCDVNFLYGNSNYENFLVYDMRAEIVIDSWYSIAATSLVLLLLIICSFFFGRDSERVADRITKPLQALCEAMEQCAKLQLETDVKQPESSLSEIKRLQHSFLVMNRAVVSFSKFAPIDVVRRLMEANREAVLGVERHSVTIMFSDLAGFAELCESHSEHQLLKVLSEYFDHMTSLVSASGGTMLEFIGDAILAIWNAPIPIYDHAAVTIKTALRMNEFLASLQSEWKATIPRVHIRIGIHTADVFVGNIGSPKRMKYGVLGDGVNLASRLEELNKRYKTSILISESVAKEVKVKEVYLLRLVDIVVVKGRQQSTPIFEVMGFKKEADDKITQICNKHNEAMKKYLGREFVEAKNIFLEILKLRKGQKDYVVDILLARTNEFISLPPPENWDGVDVLYQKTF